MSRRAALLVAGAGLALLVLALLLGFSDLPELARRARELRWPWALAAVAAALGSYAGIGACQRSLLALLGHPLPLGLMVRAAFVSTVTNRTLRSGGATGFALLAWVLARRGVPAGAVLGATAGALLLTNAVFSMLFVAAVPVAAVSWREGPGAVFVLAGVAAGFLLSLAVGAAAFFHDELRARWSRRALGWTRRLATTFRRPHWEATAAGFLSRFDAAARLLLGRRRETGPAWAWAVARISASVACLWLAVAATGTRLGPAELLLTYTAGKTVGTLALVPGGLGLVEGSLAGVLVAFGLDYEQALLAALTWRAAYSAVPAGVALLALVPGWGGEKPSGQEPPGPAVSPESRGG